MSAGSSRGGRARPPRPSLRLRLFVAGEAPNSVAARANLTAILAACGRSDAEVEIVDVFDQPERALADHVLVTPLLVRLEPAPERRIVGNLGDRALVIRGLGLEEGG